MGEWVFSWVGGFDVQTEFVSGFMYVKIDIVEKIKIEQNQILRSNKDRNRS